MVPKVAGKGRSFKGAGLYYLHDKNALTRDRVAFTHTENLITRDPDKAIKCMAWTALRQQELKARVGGSAKGRKLTQPVYCYSLSWAPGEEPSEEEMIGAAKETLKILGLEGHETLFVGHNDEPHKHIHVIVNRVHPETGVAAPLKMDHLKLSAWAEEFEKQQGQIRCEQRVENNERRRYGDFVKDYDSQKAAEYRRWQQERTLRQSDNRALAAAVLEDRHDREYSALCDGRDRKIEAKRKQVRDATKREWRSLYRGQREERGRLDTAQRSAWGRLRFYIRTYGADFRIATPAERKAMLKSAFAALIGSKRQYKELERKQRGERKKQADKERALVKQHTRAIHEKHRQDLEAQRKRHQQERRELFARQREEKARQASARRTGEDLRVFEREREAQRRQEIKEQKQDITQPSEREPKNDLRARFRSARGTQVRRQAEQETTSGNVSGGLAGQYRRAQEEMEQSRGREFRDNAREVSSDRGREKSRERKPRPPEPEGS